jgi:threonine/homoserine/homoserine lactone efflux protein
MINFFGISNFGLFYAAVLLLNATPGPDTAYIVGRSATQGRTAGLVSALGISVGCCVHSVAAALGLSARLTASATAFTLVKLAGGAYWVHLGIRMLLNRPPVPLQASIVHATRPVKVVFWQAFITHVLNPKVILFPLSFFPQFVRVDRPSRTGAFLLLGATFVATTTIWNSGTAFVAGTLARRAGRNPRVKLWLEHTVGAAFVALGIKLEFTKS